MSTMLTMLVAPEPALAASIRLSVNQGMIGQQISITGSGFAVSADASRGVNILFGEYPGDAGAAMDYAAKVYKHVQIAELNNNGSFTSSFTVPAKLDSGTTKKEVTKGSYYVWVTYFDPGPPPSKGQTILNIVQFNVVAGIVTIFPESGPVGTEVTINGYYFGIGEEALIDYDGSPIRFSGSSTTNTNGETGALKIRVPEGARGKRSITVTGAASRTSAQVSFSVEPSANISPASGPAGEWITASGTGFPGQAHVLIRFGTTTINIVPANTNGSFKYMFPAPAKAAGVYDVTFSDAAGDWVAMKFSLAGSALQVVPNSGRIGASANVSGGNFLPFRPVTITLDDIVIANASSTEQGTFNTAFNVPLVASGAHRIIASDGTNNASAQFWVATSLMIIPESSIIIPGYVGSEITIKGAGFDAGTTVVLLYDDVEQITTTAAADETFSAAFRIPPGTAGEHTITASGDNGVQQTVFVVESTPPAWPVPVQPAMGMKADSGEVSFDWDDVMDPSGVTYDLQVAKDDAFSLGAIVFEQTGITDSQYVTPYEQRLNTRGEDRPYYWRVRAVDGAGNTSLWAGTGTFYVVDTQKAQAINFTIGVGIGAAIGVPIVTALWFAKRRWRSNKGVKPF